MEQYWQHCEDVQRFVQGEMTEAETLAFEQQVQKDAALAEWVHFEQETYTHLLLLEGERAYAGLHISHTGLEAGITERIQQAGEVWKQQAGHGLSHLPGSAGAPVVPLKRRRRWWLWGVAAAGLIMAALFTVMWVNRRHGNTGTTIVHKKTDTATKPDARQPQPVDYKALYAQFYTKDPAPANAPQVLRRALDAYNQNDYGPLQELDPERLPIAKGSNEAQRAKELAYYYKGLVCMENGEYDKAGKHFNWVMQYTKDEGLINNSRWYLALAYLQFDDPKASKSLFKSIAEGKTKPHLKIKARKIIEQFN